MLQIDSFWRKSCCVCVSIYLSIQITQNLGRFIKAGTVQYHRIPYFSIYVQALSSTTFNLRLRIVIFFETPVEFRVIPDDIKHSNSDTTSNISANI